MAERTRPYIQIRPVHESWRAVGERVYYHGRFRGFSAGAHAHEKLQLLVPLGGRMRLVAGGRDHLLGPEWGALIPPGVSHAVTHLDGEVQFLAVDLEAAALAHWADATGLEVPRAPTEVVSLREPRLWQLAQHMAAELDEPRPGADAVLAHGLALLGIHVARAMQAEPAQAPIKEPRVLRAVDRILREFAEPLTVEALAAELALSPRHFERCFKEAVGHSPRRFLIEVRIGAARELLAQTALSVAEIALEVGFKNPSHFAETFQRVVGESPNAYRKARRS